MATFVLVHGGVGGAWYWRDVARGLEVRGHEAFRPTLTGLGERCHLLSPDVSLETHICDVVNVLFFEDLRDVVLCGHSYGGMVITGVTDEAANRLSHVVYIDAVVPEDGQSMFDVLPPEVTAELRERADVDGEGWRVPVPPDFDTPGIPPERASWYRERLVDHPLRTLEEPIRIRGGSSVPRTFISCTDGRRLVSSPAALRAKAEGWGFREIESVHDVQVAAPDALIDVLHEVGSNVEPSLR